MTLREAADKCVSDWWNSVDAVTYPDDLHDLQRRVAEFATRCAADEREACLTRAAEAMVKIGLHPLQRHNVLRAIGKEKE